jgi:hypothetical protein
MGMHNRPNRGSRAGAYAPPTKINQSINSPLHLSFHKFGTSILNPEINRLIRQIKMSTLSNGLQKFNLIFNVQRN